MATTTKKKPTPTTAAVPKVDARRAAAARRRESAAKLLEEMTPVVEKLGGWDAHGLKTDLATIGSHLTPGVEVQYLVANLGFIFSQGTMGDDAQRAFRNVLDALREGGLSQVSQTKVKLLRAAHGHGEVTPGDVWPFEIKLLPIEKLFADDSYQRPKDESFVRGLLIKFDERLVGSVDVSARTGGKYAIMDGLQRVETMRRLGKTACYCTIYAGMDVAAEADFFYKKNKERKNMAYWYAFRARKLSGDPTARLIAEIVEKVGFKLGPGTDHKETIGAVRAVEDVYAMETELWPSALTPTLEIVRSCFYGRPSSLEGTLLRGLGRFFSLYDKKEVQWKHFEEILSALGPALVLGRSKDYADAPENKGAPIGASLASVLVQIHNQGLARGERLDASRVPRPSGKRWQGRRR